MGHIRNPRLLAIAAAAIVLAGTSLPARAQDPDDLKRGVGRLSLMNGDVSVRRGDNGEWVAGVINAPLLTDDSIATGPNSRTELQFDGSNVLRIGANGELHLTAVEYGHYQMELARGVMTYRILRNPNATVEIDTPSLSVRPSREGSVRVSVNEAGETEVTARGGDIEIFTPRGSQWLHNGETMMARGSASDPEFQIVNAGGTDDWDRWCESRDHLLTNSVSSRYVGPGVYGTEDLDAAGQWTNVPEYGNVWYPTGVAADWSPYSAGRWVWEDWYGWTWVSYDPWGWAPYHYGRWFHHDRFGWCWYPGVLGVRHYWSPALVAFVGFGGGGGFGFGFGNVGWVPLAPYEVFHPWWGRGYYGRGFGFNRGVNITNINIVNTYRNARWNGGVNAVRVNDFQSGRFGAISRMNGNQIREAGAVHGAMPFRPTDRATHFTDRQAAVVGRASQNTRFFMHQQPTAIQHTLTGNTMTLRPQNSPQTMRGGQTGGSGDNGWRRFGTPGGQQAPGNRGINEPVNRGGFGSRGTQPQVQQQAPMQRNDRPAPQMQQQQPAQRNDNNRGGWQRFGSPGQGNSVPQQRQQQPNNPPARQQFQGSPYNDRPQQQYNSPGNRYGNGGSRQESLRIAPPVVRERPSYNAPAPRQSAPSYSAPRQQQYSAPRQSAPSYSAPRQSAPSYSAPRQSAPSGGGNHGNSGGGNHGGRR